jgi:hypothetical protein
MSYTGKLAQAIEMSYSAIRPANVQFHASAAALSSRTAVSGRLADRQELTQIGSLLVLRLRET